MILIKCIKCSVEIDRKTGKCPKCGTQIIENSLIIEDEKGNITICPNLDEQIERRIKKSEEK